MLKLRIMNLLYNTAGLLSWALVLGAAVPAAGQDEWHDPTVNAINRAPMHTSYFAYPDAGQASSGCRENAANYMSLNGLWKFNWVRDADMRPTDFYRTGFTADNEIITG